MAAKSFLALIAGIPERVFGVQTSAGAANAGDIPALSDNGRFDLSLMPAGLGANTTIAPAAELISAGKFVQFFDDGGTFSVRLADNSNNRPADGFVLVEAALGASATVYPLDSTNSALSGLVVGTRYWLGTAGNALAAPLDEADAGSVGKVSQYLGVAKSATELVTDDRGYVVL